MNPFEWSHYTRNHDGEKCVAVQYTGSNRTEIKHFPGIIFESDLLLSEEGELRFRQHPDSPPQCIMLGDYLVWNGAELTVWNQKGFHHAFRVPRFGAIIANSPS